MGGIPGEYRKLRIHAQDCEQDDWRHALPTEHWYGVRVTRERRKNYASWQERQREAMAAADERGFLSTYYCSTCTHPKGNHNSERNGGGVMTFTDCRRCECEQWRTSKSKGFVDNAHPQTSWAYVDTRRN
jgi:hypothetical protein